MSALTLFSYRCSVFEVFAYFSIGGKISYEIEFGKLKIHNLNAQKILQTTMGTSLNYSGLKSRTHTTLPDKRTLTFLSLITTQNFTTAHQANSKNATYISINIIY